jgi:hypothetical protein
LSSTSRDHGLVARRTDAESSESVLATRMRTAGIPSRSGCPSLVRVSFESPIICGPQRVVCWAAGARGRDDPSPAGARACDDPSPAGARGRDDPSPAGTAPRSPSRTRIGNLSPGSPVQPAWSRLGLSRLVRWPTRTQKSCDRLRASVTTGSARVKLQPSVTLIRDRPPRLPSLTQTRT